MVINENARLHTELAEWTNEISPLYYHPPDNYHWGQAVILIWRRASPWCHLCHASPRCYVAMDNILTVLHSEIVPTIDPYWSEGEEIFMRSKGVWVWVTADINELPSWWWIKASFQEQSSFHIAWGPTVCAKFHHWYLTGHALDPPSFWCFRSIIFYLGAMLLTMRNIDFLIVP